VAWLDKSDQQKQQQQLGELVIARLLLLFIDIFCIFAQDCGSLNRVIDIVAMWTVIGSALSLPDAVYPQLLIITSILNNIFVSEALQFHLRVLSNGKFLELFSLLNVVNVLNIGRTLFY